MSTNIGRRKVIRTLSLVPLAAAGGASRLLAMESAPLEPQPQMRAALVALHTAKTHLDKAESDKGGHRVRAMELLQQTMAEVEAGIAFDNEHKGVPRKP